MFKLAIEVCFENHFGLIHAIFLSLGSTKSGYFFFGHPVDLNSDCEFCDKLKSRVPFLIAFREVFAIFKDSALTDIHCTHSLQTKYTTLFMQVSKAL